MNRIKYKIEGLPQDTEKYYRYEILIGNKVVYVGKAFKIKTENKLVLDITSILDNYQYKGYGILTPTWFENDYRQPQENIYVILDDSQEQHYNSVTIKLYDNNTLIENQTKNIYFHTIPFEGSRTSRLINGNTYYYGTLTPRMPLTDKLRYGQLVYSRENTTTKWNNINFGTIKGSRVYNIAIPNEDVYDGKTKILKVDKECLAPYYLCWLTSDGGFQCQPFRGKSIYSENSTTNYKLSFDENKDIANRVINGQWTLTSNILTENEYKQYMDIGRSNYLLLYITEHDKVVYVNVTNNKNELKNECNNDYKPLYYSVELETRENILNIN